MENYQVNSKVQHEESLQYSSLSVNFSHFFKNINISKRVLSQTLNRNRVYLSACGYCLNSKHLKLYFSILKLIMHLSLVECLHGFFKQNVTTRRLKNSYLNIKKPKVLSTWHKANKLQTTQRCNKIST